MVRASRYLDAKQFAKVLSDLKITHASVQVRELERLEAQRILIPVLRLRYPDAVERRWFAKNHYGWIPKGRIEPTGKRWRAACELEKARQAGRSHWSTNDPLESQNPLDQPKEEWRQFIQFPSRRKFVQWDDFDVQVDCDDGPTWHKETAVTYYSSWQALLFLECHAMGIRMLGNTTDWWFDDPVPDSFLRSISFEPVRAIKAFDKYRKLLDAVVWFSEEDSRNDNFVLRNAHGRRMIEDSERAEMERRSEVLALRARKTFRLTYPKLIELSQYLCGRWDHWRRIGFEHHARAYKGFLADTIALTRYVRDVPQEQLISDVGRATSYLKPALQVIFVDWAAEWREDAERLLKSFGSHDAIVRAEFEADDVLSFLGFVEENDFFEFYWRWRSLNERAFSNDSNLLAGLRSDLQGMALSVEHIVDALLKENVSHTKQQLYEKFKQIWPANTPIGRLLKKSEFRDIAYAKGVIDLDWFDDNQDKCADIRIASDLVICHAIRGNAHNKVSETNQLRLEKLSLILLRGVMCAFVECQRRWSSEAENI